MCSKIFHRILFICTLIAGAQLYVCAQSRSPVFKGAVKEVRNKFYNNTIAGIKRNLATPLNSENEENWSSAFNAINLLKYNTPFITAKISYAVKNMDTRSNAFKKSLIELLNSDYPVKYANQIKSVFINAGEDVRLMAMAATYILPVATAEEVKIMQKRIQQKLQLMPDDAVLFELNEQLKNWGKKRSVPSGKTFFSPDYLPGQVLVFSLQRQDRNYPGLTIVRNADGRFVKNGDGTFFSVGQLARSESNMTGYISMGNTPQGIFRMDGFDTSRNYFIGPTTNIQLTMPFEFKASHFYNDSTLTDSVWSIEQYANLLPPNFKKYHPLYGTYYAGKAGRNEIIAHGTTIDPVYYKSKTYFPYTPSAGCLVTKEYWNEKTGMLQVSDQILLTNAIVAAGGPKGYLIVIEIDDKKTPVTFSDIEGFFNRQQNGK